MGTQGHLRALPGARRQPRLLSVDEVGKALECSRRTVFRLIGSGDLPSIKVGRTRRVVADDVDAYIAAARIAGPPTAGPEPVSGRD